MCNNREELDIIHYLHGIAKPGTNYPLICLLHRNSFMECARLCTLIVQIVVDSHHLSCGTIMCLHTYNIQRRNNTSYNYCTIQIVAIGFACQLIGRRFEFQEFELSSTHKWRLSYDFNF